MNNDTLCGPTETIPCLFKQCGGMILHGTLPVKHYDVREIHSLKLM